MATTRPSAGPALAERRSGAVLVLEPEVPGVAFTTRLGGSSGRPYDSLNLSFEVGDDPARVEANRRAVSEALGIPVTWGTARQVHRRGVVIARAPGARRPAVGDVVVANDPGLPVAVLVADCVPIALVGTGCVAAVHAGWRGLCAGVVEAAVAAAGEPVVAILGPSIGPCHYEVGPEVPEAFRRRHPDAPDVTATIGGRLWFDLRAAARWLLASTARVRVLDADPPCTACDPRFFSHRRDGVTGRQALLVWRGSTL